MTDEISMDWILFVRNDALIIVLVDIQRLTAVAGHVDVVIE